jgi:hypothetical protein
MLVLIGKSGSSVNYLLEWVCSCATLVGITVGRALAALRDEEAAFPAGRAGMIAMAVALAAQPFLLPPARANFAALNVEAARVAPALIGAIRDAARPIVTDDVVAPLRAGQQVLWEPAIFTELASLGRWDSALIVAAIREGAFAFAVTYGLRGSQRDSRYNPVVADAMDEAWPQKARLGWLVLHLPPDAPLPPGAVPLAEPR